MVGFINTLLFASIFLMGEAVLTDQIDDTVVILVTEDQDPAREDSNLIKFDGDPIKSEVYPIASAKHPIKMATICNENYTRYTAIIWPDTSLPGVWAFYLDYGDLEKTFKDDPNKYPIHRQKGLPHNVYTYDDKYHVRFSTGFTDTLTYTDYKDTIQISLPRPVGDVPP